MADVSLVACRREFITSGRERQQQSDMELCSAPKMKMRMGSNVPPGLSFPGGIIPGFRCAPPWANFLRSLRELRFSDESGLGGMATIFRAGPSPRSRMTCS